MHVPRQDTPATLTFNICYCLIALAWAWLVTVLVVDWNDNLARLDKRLEEAVLLSSTFCSTSQGAKLAKEFAYCEEADLMVSNKGNLKIKALEKTIRSVTVRAISASADISVSMLGNVAAVALAAAAVAVICNNLTKMINGSGQIELMSPIAQARLNTYIDVSAHQD